MKTLFQYIFSIFSLLILFSCSNDFLNEEPEFPAYTETGIYISPEWGTNDYPIHFSSVKNEKFTIENEPQWLNLTTGTGQFNNGVAYINCSASKNSDFSKVGIYSALMTLNIENKGKQSVQVGYINEGNPVFESENSLKLGYNTGFQAFFPIKNSGEGLLVWEITAYPEWKIENCPEWITFSEENGLLYPSYSD
ncbi:hypothetical protein FACS189426_15770 [Bacteroidia bacterium]|nr:hypothetical protein FACS189426_15770 [Bacteroidia bacterium]GHT86476.1 hypothetical protein FACS18947_6340 [Bacteroidia bacterium]